MKYEKPATTFTSQVEKLLSRGLKADKETLLHRLQQVSYYRLSGYLYPYRIKDKEGALTDVFNEGTTLNEVWRRYCFDRRLRVLLLDAIERIEVSLRTKLVYKHSHKHGAFGYADYRTLPKLKHEDYLKWRMSLQEEVGRSKESFKKHYFKKYDEEQILPLWMVAELMSMGSTMTFLRGIEPDLKKKIAMEYGIVDEVLLNWMQALNACRNMAAHHARLWNTVLGYQVLYPTEKKYPLWNVNTKAVNNRSGSLLLICRYLLNIISPSSKWHERVNDLFQEYAEVPVKNMGLQAPLVENPLWVSPPPLSNQH